MFSVQTHYTSSWFNIESSKPYYKLSATRERLHYPTWIYDAVNTTDDIEIFIKVGIIIYINEFKYTLINLFFQNNQENLTELYSTMFEGDNVTYTCPLGYIFKVIVQGYNSKYQLFLNIS